MRYTYYYTTFFVATFNVKCELCRNSFMFEKEFCSSADGPSLEIAKNKAIEKKDALIETLKMLVIQKANINIPIIQRTGTKSPIIAITGLVKPYKCPKCGYLQSWMLMDARRRHFLPWSLLYGFMFIVITLSLGSSTIKIIEEKGFPTVYALLLISSFVIIMIIGIVGAFVIRRNWLKYDPNKKVLQGRTAPTETHLTQISFRPGRLLEPAIETLKDENRDA